MGTVNWKRLAITCLMAGILGLGAKNGELEAGGAKKPEGGEDQPGLAKKVRKTDRFGDLLPEGARARMGTMRWRHSGTISFVGFAAKGKELVTGCSDGFFRVWEVASGKEIRRFGKGSSTVGGPGGMMAGGVGFLVLNFLTGGGGVALSPDGLTLAETGADGTVRLWDVAGGKELRQLGGMEPKQNIVRRFRGSGGASLAFAPDGKTLATRGNDQIIRLVDTTTGKELVSLSSGPNGGVAGGFGGFGYYAGSLPLVFSPDGSALASADLNAMGGRIVIGGQVPAAGNAVTLWELARSHKPRRFESGQRGSTALAFSPDGRFIVTANNDQTISGWEILTGKECFQIKPAEANKPAIHPPNPGWAIRPAMTSGITCLALSTDGRTLAAGGQDRSVRLWDLPTGKPLGKFTGHEGPVLSVLFAPDNKTVISGSADTTALVWEAAHLIDKNRTPPAELKEEQASELWKDLGGDPNKAFQAIYTLSAAPKQAVALCQKNLKPAAGVDGQRLKRLIADLDSENFAARKKATSELEKLGELAQPALQKVLEGQPSLEMRRRVQRLLDLIASDQVLSPEVLRALRAV